MCPLKVILGLIRKCLKLSSMESFRALKYSNLAFGFEGPRILQSGEFYGPKTLQFGAFLGPKILQSGCRDLGPKKSPICTLNASNMATETLDIYITITYTVWHFEKIIKWVSP